MKAQAYNIGNIKCTVVKKHRFSDGSSIEVAVTEGLQRMFASSNMPSEKEKEKLKDLIPSALKFLATLGPWREGSVVFRHFYQDLSGNLHSVLVVIVVVLPPDGRYKILLARPSDFQYSLDLLMRIYEATEEAGLSYLEHLHKSSQKAQML